MKFRKAKREDVSSIIEMFSNDILGQTREQYKTPLPKTHLDAFEIIDSDQTQELTVIVDKNHEVIATFQLTFIQYLNYQCGLRAQLESIHVTEDKRGHGIGKHILNWAIERSEQRNARILQLTSDKQRLQAIKFYENFGFKPSHEGMKLHFTKKQKANS